MGPAMSEEVVRLRLRATPDGVSTELDRLRGLLSARGFDAALGANVAIVLGEILNNIVEHALAGRDDAWIALKVRRHAGCLHVETRDEGRPLPPGLLTSGDLPRHGTTTEDLPEGGFGWFIIHSLTDDMVYERAEGQNRLSFSVCGQTDRPPAGAVIH